MTEPRPPRSQAGLTLMELMLVGLVIGIIALSASMAASDSGEYNLNLVETQVRDALAHARALARTTRTGYGVVFDPADESFAVVDESGSAAVDPLTKADYVVHLEAPNQPRGVSIEAAAFGLAGKAALFDPQGYPLTPGNLVLKCGSATRVLHLDKATGQLRAP